MFTITISVTNAMAEKIGFRLVTLFLLSKLLQEFLMEC